MKKTILLLFLSFALLLAAARPKVGVVLSGGGAKGVAHISAIKVMEEAGIPIDYIVGTSMGSLIGALYAIGYTPAQMDSLVRVQDWANLLTDASDRRSKRLETRRSKDRFIISIPFRDRPSDALKGGLLQGRNLAILFSELTEHYQDSIDFRDLPIPFACVAHNLVDGTEYDFRSGKLALAMRASMSIPGVFQPVHWNGMVLVDGGMSNNYPVDIARSMGADIIVGVDVQDRLYTADELNTLPDILGQIVNLMVENKYADNVAHSDLHIKVDASGYSAASFTTAAIDTLLRRGETAARDQLPALLALKRRIGIADDYKPTHQNVILPTEERDIPIVPEIDPGMIPNNSLNLGIKFDSEALASIIVNSQYFLGNSQTRCVALTVRLGRKSLGRLDYVSHKFENKWSLHAAYQFSRNDLDLYHYGKKTCTYSFTEHLAEGGLARERHFLRTSFTARYENYHFNDFLLPAGVNALTDVENESYFIYNAQMQFDNLNKRSYPDRGMAWKADFSVYTNNLISYKGHTAMPILSASWQMAIPLAPRLTLLPWAYGRAIFVDNYSYAFPVMNVVGGNYVSQHLPQQIPFVGINYMQITGSKTAVGGINLRARIEGNNYLTLTANAAMQNEEWEDILKQKFWGAGVTYGYNTFIGPLELTIHYSNVTQKVGGYLSWGYHF